MANKKVLASEINNATNVASENDPEIDILKELNFENTEIANTESDNLTLIL